MKLELKRISHSPRLSEETEAFAADLWIDGVKAASVSNDGRGGSHLIRHYDRDKLDLIRQAEEYCKSLPPIDSQYGKLNMDLDFKITLLFQDWLDQKDYAKALVFRDEKGRTMECKWKGITVSKMLTTQNGVAMIQRKVNELKARGCTILNTNLGFINK